MPWAQLIWRKPDGSEVAFPLSAQTIDVGRDPACAIQMDAPLVSRHHARIARRGEHYVVTDLESTNCTRVNGDVIEERELEHGDAICFAREQCIFLVSEDVRAQREPPIAKTE